MSVSNRLFLKCLFLKAFYVELLLKFVRCKANRPIYNAVLNAVWQNSIPFPFQLIWLGDTVYNSPSQVLEGRFDEKLLVQD